MDNKSLKSIIQKTKGIAGDGIKKANEVANKIVGEISEGIDSIKENKARSEFASSILTEVMQCIEDIEIEREIQSSEEIRSEQDSLIKELRDLSNLVEGNPYNCVDAIVGAMEKYANALEDIHSIYENPLTMQVLQKDYEVALRACKDARRRLEEETIKTRKKNCKESK